MQFAENIAISRHLVGIHSRAKCAALKLLMLPRAALPIELMLRVHTFNQKTILNSHLILDLREYSSSLIVKLFATSASNHI